MQSNLANTYAELGRFEDALSLRRDVYSGRLRLYGEEHEMTLTAANNYASTLRGLKRFKEAKALLRKVVPVARRVLGESYGTTLRMRSIYAQALYRDDGATLDELREGVETYEDVERTARRVLGGAHPLTPAFESHLKWSRAALAARQTPPRSA